MMKDAAVSSAEAAGYLNLRIKSSKAFPMSEVSAIEEIITKVKKMKDNKDRKNKKVVNNPQQLFLSHQDINTSSLDTITNDYLYIQQNSMNIGHNGAKVATFVN